jgi:hypothetical protein
MSKPTFQEWFCLRDSRKNFQIDPVRDQQHLFGEPVWEDEINSRLKQSQLLGTPVRLVWWGQYGIGKTHRLHHTQYLVGKKGYTYLPVYTKATDIQEKTGFERLHYELINSLGRDEMQKMVSSYFLKLKTGVPPNLPTLKEITANSNDVESALKSFGGDNDKLVLPAWRFLCGLKLKGTDLELANVTKDCLNSSAEFSAVISALATIIQLETQQEVLFLVDEAENLQKITNKTAEARWNESLRAVLDIANVGFVFAIGAERQDGMPKLILQPDIVRRVQRDNYVHMEAYKPPVAKSFVRGILGAWIDPNKKKHLEDAEGLPSSYPDYDSEVYPFTQGSFDKFCDWVVVDQRTAKPSEIIARLNNVAAEAYFHDKKVINKDLLTELGIA